MAMKLFVQTADGQDCAFRVTLEARVDREDHDLGAHCRISGWRGTSAPLTLGFPISRAIPRIRPISGRRTGPARNRIAGGRLFSTMSPISSNATRARSTILHGGRRSTASGLWDAVSHGADYAVFSIIDPDGQSAIVVQCET